VVRLDDESEVREHSQCKSLKEDKQINHQSDRSFRNEGFLLLLTLRLL